MLVFSYQGFDNNAGVASLRSLVGDAETFSTIAKTKFPGERTAFVGESIRAAVGMCLAARVGDLGGVVGEGIVDPKTVATDKLRGWWFLFPLFPISYPAAALIGATVPEELGVEKCMQWFSETPVLFVHHPKDFVTPYSRARELSDIDAGEKKFVEPAPGVPPQYHLNLGEDRAARADVLRFVQHSLRMGVPGRSSARSGLGSSNPTVAVVPRSQ
ncbi:MAG: hypothetical protein ACREMO_10480 [Gemmatimonadales bacterium]